MKLKEHKIVINPVMWIFSGGFVYIAGWLLVPSDDMNNEIKLIVTIFRVLVGLMAAMTFMAGLFWDDFKDKENEIKSW